MNQISPKKLLHSKWTKINVSNKEKHFIVTAVDFDEQQLVIDCRITAVMNNNEYQINWRDLKNPGQWKMGWQ